MRQSPTPKAFSVVANDNKQGEWPKNAKKKDGQLLLAGLTDRMHYFIYKRAYCRAPHNLYSIL